MKLAAFSINGKKTYGKINEDFVVEAPSELLARYNDISEAANINGLKHLFNCWDSKNQYDLRDIKYLLPIARPNKIICVGVNYPDRNAEYKDGSSSPQNPSLFIRFPSTFTAHLNPLIRPPESDQLDYEGEIAIIIGAPGRRISVETAFDHIAAFTLCNEGTIRDWLRHAKFNVTQGKNWYKSGSLGPYLLQFRNKEQLIDKRIQTLVNGELRQNDNTNNMIFGFDYIIHYVSTFIELSPGDVLICGTPTGAGARLNPPKWLKPGDIVEVKVDGIGSLINSVQDEVI